MSDAARILVVDDDPKIRTVVRRGLAYEGYRVVEAGSGEEGLEKAREHLPDLVVKEAYFYGGAFYRWDDAVVISARCEFNTLGLGFSYDINTSSLSNLAGSSNAFEISISYVSYVKRGNRSKSFHSLPRYF